MPNRPTPEPRPAKPPAIGSGTETDIGELTALFSAHSGGKLPGGVSADLALEIVLNEIVEQACLATGATGAAVLLERDGEMMCRASAGVTAPHLGARVGTAGLTAECIRTRRVQHCDDTQSDPRVDVEASRTLGVRSVMVLPLLRDGVMAGVLEVFSSRPAAFGERDEVTLQVLAEQILKNLARAHQPILADQPAVPITPAKTPQPSLSESEVEEFPTSLHPPVVEQAPIQQERESIPQPADRWLTLALSAAVLACSVLLAIVVGYRLGWRRVAGEKISVENPAASKNPELIEPQAATVPASGAANPSASNLTANSSPSNGEGALATRKNTAASKSSARSNGASLPEGGLAVYENGKEIFSIPPAGQASPGVSSPGNPAPGNPAPIKPAPIKNDQPSSALVPAGIIELTPKAAAGSLLHRVEPEYPEAARLQKIQGAVVLDVHIGRDGGIQDVTVISGPSPLADAAVTAVKQWRFRPQTRSGKPVEMQTRVTLNFRLPG